MSRLLAFAPALLLATASASAADLGTITVNLASVAGVAVQGAQPW